MFGIFGPYLTFDVILGTLFISSLAVYFWWGGHISWLILNDKKMPPWVVRWIGEPNLPYSKVVEKTKPHHIYLGKGVAWGINIFWIWSWLFVFPNRNTFPYQPIIENITLLHIGGATFELVMFLAITGFLRWISQER